MATLLQRIKRAWEIVRSEEVLDDEQLKVLAKEIEKVETKSDGFFGSFMTEEEIAQDIKENDLGWKVIYDRVRNLGKKSNNG